MLFFRSDLNSTSNNAVISFEKGFGWYESIQSNFTFPFNRCSRQYRYSHCHSLLFYRLLLNTLSAETNHFMQIQGVFGKYGYVLFGLKVVVFNVTKYIISSIIDPPPPINKQTVKDPWNVTPYGTPACAWVKIQLSNCTFTQVQYFRTFFSSELSLLAVLSHSRDKECGISCLVKANESLKIIGNKTNPLVNEILYLNETTYINKGHIIFFNYRRADGRTDRQTQFVVTKGKFVLDIVRQTKPTTGIM